MASLASEITVTQAGEFLGRFGRFGGTVSRLRRLMGNDALMARWVAELDKYPEFCLIHDLFTPLVDKLKLVRSYPGVTAEQIAAAVEEYDASERKKSYDAAIETHLLLDTVVTVYRESVPATLLYARERMRDTFGEDHFDELDEAYAQGVDDERVRLLQGIPDLRNCVRIEVVDLGAHFNPKDGFIPKDIRGSCSATFAVIYAAAQNPEWVWQMDSSKVPFALVGGLELNVPGFDEWSGIPHVWPCGGKAMLYGNHCGKRYRDSTLPFLLWEK